MPNWFGWALLLWAVADLIVVILRGMSKRGTYEILGTSVGVIIQTVMILGIWVWIIIGE